VFEKLCDSYEDYISELERRGSGERSDPSAEGARAYIRVCRQNTTAESGLVQLVDYIVDRAHMTALVDVCGRVSSRDIRARAQ
jgi:hypothetical protein